MLSTRSPATSDRRRCGATTSGWRARDASCRWAPRRCGGLGHRPRRRHRHRRISGRCARRRDRVTPAHHRYDTQAAPLDRPTVNNAACAYGCVNLCERERPRVSDIPGLILLKGVAGVNPTFMSTDDKATALGEAGPRQGTASGAHRDSPGSACRPRQDPVMARSASRSLCLTTSPIAVDPHRG